ncbi:alpha/beta hydrolase-fold protein [Streptacidiphilus sp. PAMC 29251]
MNPLSRRTFVAGVAGAGGVLAVAPAMPAGAASALGAASTASAATDRARPKITAYVTLSPAASRAAVTGRVYVILTRDPTSEPREQTADVTDGAPFWGLDVQDLRPGTTTCFALDASSTGYPLADAADLPAGTYHAQAFVNVYTRFARASGPAVHLHLPGGDGNDVFNSTGNLYGPTTAFTVRAGTAPQTLLLTVDTAIKPSEPVPAGGTAQQGNPTDSRHVKHVKIRSAALSAFWGRSMYVAADVLLPLGYDDPANRSVRYPMNVTQGHYDPDAPRGFLESGANDFSRYWLSGTAPAFIVVAFRHENPFFDDSYGVDTANIGPYGTALYKELLPELDRRFRTFGQAWARVLSGGSTGGWTTVATQLFYPDLYRGAWAGYPDPLDFTALQSVDLYQDSSAYVTPHAYLHVDVPSAREISGRTLWTMGQENSWERALGDHGRSGIGQWDAWQAAFSPRGKDGYPAPIWDKSTGTIDHGVAAHWKQHYDLASYIETHWNSLRHKIDGQLTLYVGDAD